MKVDLKLPCGAELRFEREPMDDHKFGAVCKLLALGLYVALTWVIASTGNFFALIWFYGLTAAIIGMWIYTKGGVM